MDRLDIDTPESMAWLRASDLSDQARALLTGPIAANRRLQFKDATYVSLCVLNVNAAADSDKYISLGLWLEAQRVVTARRQHIGTIDEVKRELQEGDGPAARWDFLALVARQLTDQLEDCVTGLGAEVDTLEEQVLQKGRKLPIDESAAVGRRLLGVRRTWRRWRNC